MPADAYLDWLAYDQIEPLNPTGIILEGLSGKREKKGWQQQKAAMLQHAEIVKAKRKR